MKAYKLVRLRKNKTLGSLFISRKNILPVGVWMPAEDHFTKGYAHRPGWHCTFEPCAPHLSLKNRVWVEVEVHNFRIFERPAHQGGRWILANWMKIIKII